jgi:hypothetical protein
MRTILLVLFLFFSIVPGDLQAGDHAGEELAEFVRDRPEAGAILGEIPEIVEFLRVAFQGDHTSVPLDWNSREPQGNAYAENTPGENGTSILIRVSSRLGPVDQIAALVYECRNARNEKQFARSIREAYLGGLTKEEFIHGILRLEHEKMKETRAFLAPLRPFRDLDSSQTEFYRKMVGTPEGFAEFIDYLHQLKRPEYDVFAMYSKFYDYLTVTPQKRKAELDAMVSRKADSS